MLDASLPSWAAPAPSQGLLGNPTQSFPTESRGNALLPWAHLSPLCPLARTAFIKRESGNLLQADPARPLASAHATAPDLT